MARTPIGFEVPTWNVLSAEKQERLRQIGAEVVSPEGRSEDYLGKFVASEIKKWGIAIKAAGVTAE
jgi:hypothetical protein